MAEDLIYWGAPNYAPRVADRWEPVPGTPAVYLPDIVLYRTLKASKARLYWVQQVVRKSLKVGHVRYYNKKTPWLQYRRGMRKTVYHQYHQPIPEPHAHWLAHERRTWEQVLTYLTLLDLAVRMMPYVRFGLAGYLHNQSGQVRREWRVVRRDNRVSWRELRAALEAMAHHRPPIAVRVRLPEEYEQDDNWWALTRR